MEQIMEEYGGMILGILAGAAVLAGAYGLIDSGGILEKMIILFGNTAC